MTRTLIVLLLSLGVLGPGRPAGAATAPRPVLTRVPPRLPAAKPVRWSDTAVGHRGQDGLTLTLGCPAAGVAGTVWGTGPYTDDSSICTAAVHAGVITVARGGHVVIEIQRGQPAYGGSQRNGITTQVWGSWHGSFVVLSGTPGGPVSGPAAIGWESDASGYRGQNGQRYTFVCPGGGALGSLWGTGPYTDDSSVCTAAVHAGVIGQRTGGTVTIEIQAGLSAYAGSTQNGVTSQPWGTWHGSFAVHTPAPAPPAPRRP